MSFYIVIGFLVITLGFIGKYRKQIALYFLKLPWATSWIAVFAALIFSIIEEASINIVSGTLPVLLGTVPALVLFVFLFGKLGQIFKARSIRYPLVALMFFGIAFEYFVGGASGDFQSLSFSPLLVFGVTFTALTYAYTAIIALTIMIDGRRLNNEP